MAQTPHLTTRGTSPFGWFRKIAFQVSRQVIFCVFISFYILSNFGRSFEPNFQFFTSVYPFWGSRGVQGVWIDPNRVNYLSVVTSYRQFTYFDHIKVHGQAFFSSLLVSIVALPSPAVFLPCPPQELGVWTDSSMPKASPLFHYQHISFDLIEVIELSLFASSCMSMASLFFIFSISFCWHSVCLPLSYRSAMPSAGLLHWAFAFRSIQLLMHTWSVCFFGPRPLFCQSPRWRYSFGWHSACLPYSYCYARPPSGLLHWAFACCYQLLMHTWLVCFFWPRPLSCLSPRWRYSGFVSVSLSCSSSFTFALSPLPYLLSSPKWLVLAFLCMLNCHNKSTFHDQDICGGSTWATVFAFSLSLHRFMNFDHVKVFEQLYLIQAHSSQ